MNNQVFFILNEDTDEQIQWNKSIQIFIVLRGSCLFFSQGECSRMKKGDLWVVNPYDFYRITRETESDVLKAVFPEDAARELCKADEEIFCRSDLQENENPEIFAELRKELAELFLLCVKEKDNSFLIQSGMYRMLSIFDGAFVVKSAQKEAKISKDQERLKRILERINRDFAETITLKQLASEEFLSMNYLSQYFRKKVGIGFNQYLNQVRLQAAASFLNSSLSVTEVGEKCGFGDTTQFIKRFHEYYGVTPGKYRNRIEKKEQNTEEQPDVFLDFLAYAEEHEKKDYTKQDKIVTKKLCADAAARGRRFGNSWKKIVNIGFAKEGLSALIQKQLKMVQKEIGFEYIHFHGILDDDMMVYSEKEDGTPVYKFKYVDMLFDFCIDVGLKPYVELSFMPSKLAKEAKPLFAKTVNISMPTDMGKWEALIEKLAAHCISRYGLEEVGKWRFIPWTGPVAYAEYGYYTFGEYLELYKNTYRILKQINDKLQVGGPDMDSYYLWENDNEYEQFLRFCVENKCEPDFLAIGSFATEKNKAEEGTDLVLIENAESLSHAISGDEQYLKHLLERMEQIHKKIWKTAPELVLLEWNSTIWQRDLTNDTCYKAAFIAKNILENYNKTAGFGYWELSDYMEEVVPEQEEFHGGFGLLTCQNIKKSGYYCLNLLSKLGEHVISQGDGYFITKKGAGQIQIMMYNYVHFNKLYRYRHLNGVDRTHREEAFLNGVYDRYQMELKGIDDWENIRLREYTIDAEHGSAYDIWVKMGAPAALSEEEANYLRQTSVPNYHNRIVSKAAFLNMEFILKPHNVKLILIDKAEPF